MSNPKPETDEAWTLFLSDYLRPQAPTISACYWHVLEGYARPRGLTIPSESSFRRRLRREIDPRLIAERRSIAPLREAREGKRDDRACASKTIAGGADKSFRFKVDGGAL